MQVRQVNRRLRLRNTGTAPLEITNIEGEGDVSGLTFDPTMFTVAPNGSQTVTIMFPSSTTGEFFGQYQYFK